MADVPNHFRVELGERHATKLRALAERLQVSPGALASSLLSNALDQAEPDPVSIEGLLDAIPGAFERANKGMGEIHAGNGIPLNEL